MRRPDQRNPVRELNVERSDSSLLQVGFEIAKDINAVDDSDPEGLYGDDRSPAHNERDAIRDSQAARAQQNIDCGEGESGPNQVNLLLSLPCQGGVSMPPVEPQRIGQASSRPQGNVSSFRTPVTPQNQQPPPAIHQRLSQAYGRENADLQRSSRLERRRSGARHSLDSHEHIPGNMARQAGNAPPAAPPVPQQESFRTTLQRQLPTDSPLMSSITARRSLNVFIGADRPQGLHLHPRWGTEYANDLPKGGSALIIQDINITWADRLLTEFPRALSHGFFAKHMVRLDSHSISGKTAYEAATDLEHLRASLQRHCTDIILHPSPVSDDWLTVDLSSDLWAYDRIGHHIDCDLVSLTKRALHLDYRAPDRTRRLVFERHVSKDNSWRSISTRISWCQLKRDLCKTQVCSRDHPHTADMEASDLILVESIPDMMNRANPLWDSSEDNPFQRLLNLRIDTKSPLKIIRSPLLPEKGHFPTDNMRRSAACIMTTVERLVQHHTPDSVFKPQDVPFYGSTDAEVGKSHVFAWLLAASTWEDVVATMESNLQHLQRSATNKANEEAFKLLRGFRRQVADAEVLTAELKEGLVIAMKAADKWYVEGDEHLKEPGDFWKDKEATPPALLAFGQTQRAGINGLLGTLKDLDERVNLMTQTVNEEIQVVIGSVQVEDAKVMKRQTEVTVVLAVLAAIYLPLTLVTGIFGMNIKEIDEGKPNRIWVVQVWSWIFSVTILPILIYVIVRWVIRSSRNRRRSSMDQDTDSEALELD